MLFGCLVTMVISLPRMRYQQDDAKIRKNVPRGFHINKKGVVEQCVDAACLTEGSSEPTDAAIAEIKSQIEHSNGKMEMHKVKKPVVAPIKKSAAEHLTEDILFANEEFTKQMLEDEDKVDAETKADVKTEGGSFAKKSDDENESDQKRLEAQQKKDEAEKKKNESEQKKNESEQKKKESEQQKIKAERKREKERRRRKKEDREREAEKRK